jgi:hypothetical protein
MMADDDPCGYEEQEDIDTRADSIKECIGCKKADCPSKQALLELVKQYE